MRKLILILMLFFITSNGNAASFFQTALATSSYVAMSFFQNVVRAANTTNTTNSTSLKKDSKASTLSTVLHIAGALILIGGFIVTCYCCSKKFCPEDKTDTARPPTSASSNEAFTFDSEACTSRNYRKNDNTDADTKLEEYDIDIGSPKKRKKNLDGLSDYESNDLINNAEENLGLTIEETKKDLKGKGKGKGKGRKYI